MSTSGQIVEFFDQVPSGVWVVLTVANVMVTIATCSVARRRMRRAGERVADPQLVAAGAKTKDTALTVAAMIPAALFWGMVLAGSFHGLVAFGREVLGWHGGWSYLVPGTLDGVSVTFAFLAFRAVRKEKAPDRCYRVVWGAAIASATVNFAYEYTHSGHNIVAGGYLALLSLFGMVMFHEFLDQFEEGTAYVKRDNPKFGLRWISWPTNTFCAAVAWRNHPPAEGTTATILNAVANLDRVRALKHAAKETEILARHERALAATRRQAELAATKAGTQQAAWDPGDGSATMVNGGSPAPAVIPAAVAVPLLDGFAAPAPQVRPVTGADTRSDPAIAEVKVPATAATLTQWATTWIRMCTDGDLVLGPLNDDEHSRAQYDLSAKQLRNIRNAATSGALRRRAKEIEVQLPPGYVDNPAARRVNGHQIAGASA